MQPTKEVADAGIRPVEPFLARGLTAAEVAKLLGRSRSWFYAHRDRLEAAGFPKPNRITGRWDRRAVDRWCDRFGGG
ncbi:MAG: helix-turn-helix domain-containing protein [Actinomycetota bacterium]